jgi:homoserine kinase type II
MARLTDLSFADAERLLALFQIELEEWFPLEAGSVNSNFLLRARGGQEYFARLYEEQGPSGADFEFRVNEALSQAVSTKPCPRRGSLSPGPSPPWTVAFTSCTTRSQWLSTNASTVRCCAKSASPPR